MRRHCRFFSTQWSNFCRCYKASAAESECGLHSRNLFVFVNLDSYQQLPKFPRCQQQWWRTIMTNWTQVVYGCDRHCVQTFVSWYCATKSVAFFWTFSSIFSPHRGIIAISSCSYNYKCMKQPEPVLIHLAPWKNGRKTENAPQVWIHRRHLLHAKTYTVCNCLCRTARYGFVA